MMDPIEDNLFDIPDYEHTQDEVFQPLPPPASPGGDDEPVENELQQTKNSPVTARKGVRTPRPKLDAQRLVSEQGLPALRNIFDNATFKGKGHEVVDLKMLMRHMEHWAHRLFPKLPFEDFVDRVESLGNKKEVQNLSSYQIFCAMVPYTGNELFKCSRLRKGDNGESNGLSAAAEEIDIFSENQNARQEIVSSQSATLTEEQEQRIERNKKLALERRQAKLQLNSSSQADELPVAQPKEECDDIPAQEQDDLMAVEAESSPFQAMENQIEHGYEGDQ